MKAAWSLMFCIACLMSMDTAIGQTADDIIQKHITAIGGADNWKKIHSIKKSCVRMSRGVEVPVTITIMQDKGYRYDYTMNGMSGFTIINKTAGYSYNPRNEQKRHATPPEMVAQSQNLLDIQGPLIDYKAKGNKVIYYGLDDVEGTECFKLKVIFPAGKEETIFIDAVTYYLVRTVDKTKANGKDVVFTTTYGDYEKLPEGIIYPMSFEEGRSQLSIKKLDTNLAIDESVFN